MSNLREEILKLQNNLAYVEKRSTLDVKEAKMEEQEKFRNVQIELEKMKVENEQLKERIAEAPAKLYSDMLKALTAKFPTLDLKSITVNKEK